MLNFKVDPANPSCFRTIAQAIAACNASDDEIMIDIAPGHYHEKLEIRRPFITLRGNSCEDTFIEYDDNGKKLMPDGSKMGTFRSYTLLAFSHDITLENLTIANTSGPGKLVSQAIALYAEGDRINVFSCRITGSQDTLFTGPLPPSEIIPGGFIGPTQYAPRSNGRQYYKDCFICGGVDFIFGSATAYFENCTIKSIDGSGYITAASTPKGQAFGYVFNHCSFISDSSEPCYLGRPWRSYAKTVILNSILGAHIRPEGWHDWNKEEAHNLVYYAEYNNTGIGADVSKRAAFSRELTEDEAKQFSKEYVLGY